MNTPCHECVVMFVSFQVPVCVHGSLCEREKEDDSGSLCVLSWLTGPVTMMSSTWLVSTPIAVEVLTLLGFILALLSSLLEVLVVFWVSLNFCCVILLAKRVRAKTSYITISSSSDSEDEPVRFIPNVPVVVKDDEEEEDVHILEVTGAAFVHRVPV